MAVSTPDKPESVDIMNPRRIFRPGYEKVPAQSSDNAPSDPAAKEKSFSQTAPATPTTGPVKTKAGPAAYASPAAETPQAINTAANVPAAKQEDASSSAQTATPGLPKTATTAVTPALNIAFLSATDIPFWLSHNIEKIDPIAADMQCKRANAMIPGLIDNCFLAQCVSATHALPGDEGNRNERREEEERKEEKRKLAAQLTTFELINDLRSQIQRDLDFTNQEIASCENRIKVLEARNADIDSIIVSTKADINTLSKTSHREFLENEKTLRVRIENADTAIKKAEANYEASKATADPAQEEIARSTAWTANRDSIRNSYAEAGLSKEFDILERHRNGEKISDEELARTLEAIDKKGMSSNLDSALIKHLKENDPDNTYLKSSHAKKVLLDDAKQELKDAQDEYLNVMENRLLPWFERTNKQIAQKEEYIQKLEAEKGANSAEVLREKQKLAEMIERKKFQEAKLSQLDNLEKMNDSNDPNARKGVIELQKEYDEYMKNQQERLQKRIERVQQFKEREGTAYSADSAQVKSKEPENLTSVPVTKRTTTDSAAGLIEGSAIAQADGKLKGSFTVAAAGAIPSETPNPSIAADAALAAEQQRRTAPAATFGV